MDETKTVGFIDIGTNSIHLLVVKFLPGTLGVQIAQEKEMVRIGRSLYSTGSIDEDSMAKTHLVLQRFCSYAKKHGADEIISFATCAVREADNRNELLSILKQDGIEVKVIPGEEEARIIKLGVIGPSTANDEKILLIDIGGGSTEVSVSKGKDILYLDSLPIGAVRYAYGYPYDPLKPITKEEYESYQHNVDLHSYLTVQKIKEIGFDRVICSSGTFETLADLCSSEKNGEYPVVKRKMIQDSMEQLRKMTVESRLKNPKLSPARADIIVAGGAIAEELMTLLGIQQIEVSGTGMKEGMMVDYRLNHGITNIGVRDSSVNSLGIRCGYDADHGAFVKDFSLMLFDRLSELGLHDIDPRLRPLLGYAAQLHDIGEFICYNKHHLNSYYIIINSNMLGFDYRETAIIAIMAKFHHKKFPSANESSFAKFGITDTLQMRQCIMMLRMADALDRHRTQIVQSAEIISDKDSLIIELESDEDISMEIWKLEGCAKDFKNIFGKQLIARSVND